VDDLNITIIGERRLFTTDSFPA